MTTYSVRNGDGSQLGTTYLPATLSVTVAIQDAFNASAVGLSAFTVWEHHPSGESLPVATFHGRPMPAVRVGRQYPEPTTAHTGGPHEM